MGGGGIYAETWCSGMFSPRACAFCDDAFAETADIAFMDAWLPEYTPDSRGTSIVLVRSRAAREMIETGVSQGKIAMTPLAVDKVIASQCGVVNQKRAMLANRLWIASRMGACPRKRVEPVQPYGHQHLLLTAVESLRVASLGAVGASHKNGQVWIDECCRRIRWPQIWLNMLLLPRACITRAKTVASQTLHLVIPR